jgi:preprotein translocase subunit SecB
MMIKGDLAEVRHLAARVAGRAHLRDVRLLQTSAKIVNLPGPKPELDYDLDVTMDVIYSDGDEAFVVQAAYAVKIVDNAEDPEDPAAVAEINFEHAALFLLDRGGDEAALKSEELEAFAKTTGQFALHPFARQYIYDVTGRLALPPLTIDLMLLPVVTESGTRDI